MFVDKVAYAAATYFGVIRRKLCCVGGICLRGLVGHDVDEAARDDDDFADRLAFGVLLDVFVLLGEGFDVLLGGVCGDFDSASEFAVDLDDDLDLVFDEVGFVELWPWLVAEQGI